MLSGPCVLENGRTSPGDILGDDSQLLPDLTVHQLTQRLPVERSDVAMYLQLCGRVKKKKARNTGCHDMLPDPARCSLG